MHVYSEGNTGRTVVLLSGLGAPCPALDFRPVFSTLREDHRVVVAEGFGYGWSDLTDTPRTVQNIIGETRIALAKAGFKPPYVLMPHSVSGLYALHWANAYPEEVEAVVGIDMTILGKIQPLDGFPCEHRDRQGGDMAEAVPGPAASIE
jgi:pimeloyl-ACP methyl ester carboxylesterase